ncbi:capping complex subunit for YIEGIA [Salimicrobium halophilum]|uniref:Uncharacterized protein n=1 Tax=Salimicrobium halophilum TaxID=86666 RepID=A0A1G8PZR3_9BACI|nr:hypothetical protein [Salimicrobium halophilum]SDI97927.1 hypothetical protein SAMN04490247_0307 [Salimicrobium halophilum]
MKMEKVILGAVTTEKSSVQGGTPVFYCEGKKEMESIAANLEAILDGIAHRLTDELYIIVKH